MRKAFNHYHTGCKHIVQLAASCKGESGTAKAIPAHRRHKPAISQMQIFHWRKHQILFLGKASDIALLRTNAWKLRSVQIRHYIMRVYHPPFTGFPEHYCCQSANSRASSFTRLAGLWSKMGSEESAGAFHRSISELRNRLHIQLLHCVNEISAPNCVSLY